MPHLVHRAARLGRVALAAAFVGVALPAAAQAPLVFFGDSFVDAGNLDHLVRTEFTLGAAGFPPEPYYQGRFSNGPVWSERLAQRLGRPLDGAPLHLGGSNYAYGGATTGAVNVTMRDPQLQGPVNKLRTALGLPPVDWNGYSASGYGTRSQVLRFVGTNPVGNAGTVAVLFAGGNDFLNDLTDPVQAAQTAVANMVGNATLLHAVGVRDFLVPSLPDLSRLPRARNLPPAQAAGLSQLVGAYNAGLHAAFGQFAAVTGANYMGLRLDTLFDNILRSPSSYGFTNTTLPCFDTLADDCATSVFVDEIHPGRQTHALVANAAYRRLRTGTDVAVIPEPSTVVLLGGGLAVLGALAARRRRAA